MNAIEFETECRNGVIKIPDKYNIKSNSHIKVIVLFDEIEIKDNVEYFENLCKKYNTVDEKDLDINEIYNSRMTGDNRDVIFD